MTQDISAFITQNLELRPLLTLPTISLYLAHERSRLSRLADPKDADPPPPYWAFTWAGGLALAQYIMGHSELVAGRRVLDLGAGSGLVAIAAARSGAIASAAERDPHGRAAIALNAAANGVEVSLLDLDIIGLPPTDIDLILAGDVFYNPEIATLMLPFLTSCRAAGIDVLIGDPDRRDLPVDRLELVASYAVGDVGESDVSRVGNVYRLK
ncbi:50S ribosomal protein L11 methyltransferase [Devosia sp. 2618]|uniref:class I SAM-dependent methyltransferase n=1 Tax=Devosia sp. 2618 TaxID=3156454 RepID=UPI00339AE4BD